MGYTADTNYVQVLLDQCRSTKIDWYWIKLLYC